MITNFRLYEENIDRFNFENYIIIYKNEEEGLYFIEKMTENGYGFFHIDVMHEPAISVADYNCFIYESKINMFILADSRVYNYEQAIELTVDEAFDMAGVEHKNSKPPVVRWYKKGKFGKI